MKVLAVPEFRYLPVEPALAALAGLCERLASMGVEVERAEDLFALVRTADFDTYAASARSRRRQALTDGFDFTVGAVTNGFGELSVVFAKRDMAGLYQIPVDEFVQMVQVELDSDGTSSPFHERWPKDVIGARKAKPAAMKTPPVSARFAVIAKLFSIKRQIGFTPEEVETCVVIHGGLPEVLSAYYLELGRHEALNETYNQLLPPDQVRDYVDYLVFFEENQQVVEWAVRKADTDQPDPPGWVTPDEGATWFLDADSVTHFLMWIACLHAVFSYEYTSEEFVTMTPLVAGQIRTRFTPVDTGTPHTSGVEFFTWHSAVIMMAENGDTFDVMWSAPTETRFDALDRMLAALSETSREA